MLAPDFKYIIQGSDIVFLLNEKVTTPLYTQLYRQIKTEICNGHFKPGTKLPSSRKLANDLQVSRNTVELAYDQLHSEGYIFTRPKSGYYIENIDFTSFPNISQNSHQEKVCEEKDYTNIKYDFQYGNLDPSQLPILKWQKMTNRCFREYKNELAKYNNIYGEIGLRKEILKYLNDYRGVKCSVDQIIVCSGTHYCLNTIAQLIKEDVSNVAIEEPGFFLARDTFQSYNFEVSPVTLDTYGLDVNQLSSTKANAVYVTPSHQFPTGTIMPISRRLELIDWANKSDSIIIEDDYSCHLRYNVKAVQSLQSLSKERVVYIGSFSKYLLPSIRVSYMVLPEKLINRFSKMFYRYPSSVPFIIQKTLQLFMEEGFWDSYIRKTIRFQKKKHDALVQALNKEFGHTITILGKDAGLHLLVQVKWPMKEEELIDKASKVGVRVYPTSEMWSYRKNLDCGAVLMGFGAIPLEHIPIAVKILRKSWIDNK